MSKDLLQAPETLRYITSNSSKTKNLDLIGPLTETPRGNKYIVTITDYFSKWAEAGPLPDKSAKGIAKFIYSNVKLYIK